MEDFPQAFPCSYLEGQSHNNENKTCNKKNEEPEAIMRGIILHKIPCSKIDRRNLTLYHSLFASDNNASIGW